MSKLSKWWAGLFDCPLKSKLNKEMKKEPFRQIGETFYHDKVLLKVCEPNNCSCDGCYFDKICLGNSSLRKRDITGPCTGFLREDEKSVIFKEIKKEKTMYKSDLKLGNIVECRNGNVYMLVEVLKRKILIRTNYANEDFDWYDEYLYNKINSEFDIMKVYSGCIDGSLEEMLYCNKGKLLWERPEEITELTLEDVAKKFNVNVKNLRIKD